MNTIDLNKIIAEHHLDVKELAAELFPGIKYPKLAFDRVLRGETYLDTNQLSRLSLYTGQSVDALICGRKWKPTSNAEKITFQSNDYVAELDAKNWITKVFHKNSLFHESVLHKSAIPLSEYLQQINEIISKHQQKL